MSKTPPADDSTLDAARAAQPEALGVFGKLAKLQGVGITRVGAGYGLKVNLACEPEVGTVLPTNIRGVPAPLAKAKPFGGTVLPTNIRGVPVKRDATDSGGDDRSMIERTM